jgi:hypothetical protein
MTRFESTDEAKVIPPLSDLVRSGRGNEQLQAEARELLYDRRFVIPGPRRVAALVRAAVGLAERQVMKQIQRDIPSQTRTRWNDKLFEPTNGCESLIDFIGEAPGKYSPTMIEREFAKVETLQALGVSRYPTEALSSEHQHMYARRITQRRPTRFRGMREPRRTLEVVSFLRHSLAEHTDIFIDLADRRVAQLWRRARDKARLGLVKE